MNPYRIYFSPERWETIWARDSDDAWYRAEYRWPNTEIKLIEKQRDLWHQLGL